MTQFDLTDKVAIITGASRGIGEATARAYVAAGAKVVISSRKPDNLNPVAAAINAEYPGQALAVAAHSGKPEAVAALVAKTVEHFGRVDIVVNNAGTNPHFGLLLTSEEWQWDKTFEVNLKGYFWLCKFAAQQMREQGEGGKIINVASVAGLSPAPMMGIYSISKAGVIMLTRVLAEELASANIQVNAVAPGFFKTRFSRAIWDNPEILQTVTGSTPAGRIGALEELTGIMQYLASPASSFTTGAVFTIDGGISISSGA